MHDGNGPKDMRGEGLCFRPKYKFYEEVRDSRKDRFLILKFRQSPGVRRRQLLGVHEPGAGDSRTDTTDMGLGEPQA